MTSIELQQNSYTSASRLIHAKTWFTLLVQRMKLWNSLVQERRHLRSLDNHILEDLGLVRSDVEREANRPFWDTAGVEERLDTDIGR